MGVYFLRHIPMEAPVKHLYRSSTNRVFSGVFGGLGEHWGIDPVILRLLWTLITVFTGFAPGIIVYIFAVFIIPMKPEGKQPVSHQ